MKIKYFTPVLGFGYFGPKITQGLDTVDQRTLSYLQVGNAAGYFPGCAQIVGIVRLVYAGRHWQGAREEKAFYVQQIARGAGEILGLSLLLFMIDIIVTAGRHFFGKWGPVIMPKV